MLVQKDNFASLSSGKAPREKSDRRIAIVGMSCLFPQAPDLASFWQNIVDGTDCTRLVTEEEWSTQRFFDPLRKSPEQQELSSGEIQANQKGRLIEKIFCRRGGFITDLADFDPLQFGVMPKAVDGSDADQMLALKLACQAIADAGYNTKPFSAENAEVIIGRTAAPGQGAMNLIQTGQTVGQFIELASKLLPELSSEQKERLANELRSSLHPCNADTIVGVMPSVLAARIAGRLGFKGRSLVLDAACASSLIAVEMAVENLRSHRSDMALAGGVFINSFAVFYQMFCGLGALSHSEKIRPFDDNADGTLLGEGIGMVVLKRLDDAIRDGDKIYACITGVGSSSNGSGTSMLAPSSDGEALALRRAYDDAGIDPKTVSLIEAHGTGTISGDLAEIQALEQVFLTDSTGHQEKHQCALGSVKSMIGHCQSASGVAGLIKAALALHHRVLPATINVSKPNSHINWDDSFFYINTKTRPWIHPKFHPRITALLPQQETLTLPRRAAVSAFGFGGVNAHTILEEYDQAEESAQASFLHNWETEVFTFIAANSAQLIDNLIDLETRLSQSEGIRLKDLAFSINNLSSQTLSTLTAAKTTTGSQSSDLFVRLAIVASSIEDLISKLATAQKSLEQADLSDTSGELGRARNFYFSGNNKVNTGQLAFILPGLGAAYPNMLAELCIHFPDVRAVFDFVDQLSALSGSNNHLSDKIFPPPTFKGSNETSATLATMDAAVVTVLMAEWALFTLLINLGVMPDVLLGCSTGEFAALTMAGATDIISAASVFYHLSTNVANSIPKEQLSELRSVMVVAPYPKIEQYSKKYSDIYLSADLSAKQVILSGGKESIEALVKELEAFGIEVHMLPAAIPYHTPLVENVVQADHEDLSKLEINAPTIAAWSCSSATSYPDDPEAIREITTRLFTKPILFRESIESLYAAGVTKFVEVGPRDSLTSVVSEILINQPHIAVASNRSTGSALTQLNHLVAALYSHGVSLNLDYLYKRREPKMVELAKLAASTIKPRRSTMKLDLSYPEVKLRTGWQERTGLSELSRSQIESTLESKSISSHTNPTTQASERKLDSPTTESPQEEVLSSYLQSLTHFHANLMRTQEEVMLSYLAEKTEQTGASPVADFSVSTNHFPLLHGASFQTSESGLTIDLTLTLAQHKYLFDHAIGSIVRGKSEFEEKVYLLPLTVAIELMAEASSFFYPSLKVLAVSNVRAFKRIRVTSEGFAVRILASPSVNASGTSEVGIYRVTDGLNGLSAEEPLMSCEITFGHEYTAKPIAPSDLKPSSELIARPMGNFSSTTDWCPSRMNPAKLYGPDAMFHGPRMQSVVSVDAVADRKIVGKVKKRTAEDWFDNKNGHGTQSPDFLVEPLLLDNATQLVLFYLFELGEPVNALLPFLIDSIRFYEDLSTVSGEVTVRAKLNSLTPRGTEADVFICDETDRVIAEFQSISSRRIALETAWQKFIFGSDRTYLTSELQAPLNSPPDIKLRIIQDVSLPKDEATLSWCADYVLAPIEIQSYESLSGLARKREWLLGRIAAKEAVRTLASKLFSINLCSADVIIFVNDDGKPFVVDIDVAGDSWQPHISISHKDGTAIAIAVDPASAKSVGIDLESISPREEGFEKLALTEQERSRFENQLMTARDQFLAKAWSAKEAGGKAVGSGLAGNPQNFEITSMDVQSCRLAVRLKTATASNSPLGTRRNHSSVTSEQAFQAQCLSLNSHVLSIVTIPSKR